MTKQKWLLLLTQIPASASTTRVSVWRKLRAAGATSVEHGAWMLPKNIARQQLLSDIADTVRDHGGSATLFEAKALADDEEMIARFTRDRLGEYQEFATRTQGLLDEVAKEIAAAKFTFAELEEVEADLKKLEVWLAKVIARDFFGGARQAAARDQLAVCARAVEGFAKSVYAVDGVTIR